MFPDPSMAPPGALDKIMLDHALLPMVSPHERAPRASLLTPEELAELIPILGREIEKGIENLDEETLEFIREVGYVSLYFFTKYIAGHSGPFNLLNEELHLDMCNYRQSLLEDGCRGAMFIPRSHYKSTIVTEAASAWEALRNPDIRILIAGSTAGKAQSFMLSVKAIFDENDLMKLLYIEYVPEGARPPRWNDTEMVLPNRTRRFREPTVEYIGSGGASEGHHYDLIVCDDLIGLKALNSNQMSSAEMQRTKNWFWGSEDTLLVSVKISRVIVVGTRYAADDLYSDILALTKEMVGCELPGWEADTEGGVWRCYYRMCIEGGEVIFPENWSLEAYELMKKKHYFTFMSQFMNYPQGAGLAEFYELRIKPCVCDWDQTGMGYIIIPDEKIPLSNCTLVIAADPAATERYIEARTSRTAVGVMATDPGGRRFFIEIRADHVPVSTLISWLFSLHRRYKAFRPRTLLEMQGAFRMLKSTLEEKQQAEQYYLGMDKVSCVGDKDARIRSALEPPMIEGLLYVNEVYMNIVKEEKDNFPQSVKKDVLDMMQIAINGSPIPFYMKDYINKGKGHRSRKRWEETSSLTGY